MIIEQLYDDDRINDTFLDVGFSEYAADAFSTALDCAKRMRDKYEADRAAQAAEIDRLKAALVWQPVTEENTELIDPNADDDRRLYIDDEGTGIEFTCDSGELEGYFNLPEGYAVCRKVQP